MIRNKYIALFIGSKIVPKCGGLRVNTFSCHRKSQKDLCCRGKETDLGWEIEQGLQFKVKFSFSFFKLPCLLPKWWITLAFSCQRYLYWEQYCQAKICKILQMGGISFNNFKLFFQFCIWDNLQVLLNSSSTVLLWAYNFVIWGHLHGKPREMLWFFVFITLLFSNVVVWGDIRAYHMIPVKRLKIRTLRYWLRVWLFQEFNCGCHKV